MFQNSGITDLLIRDVSDQIPTTFELDLSPASGYTKCDQVKFGVQHDEVYQEIPISGS
jgi:hypothetical protein